MSDPSNSNASQTINYTLQLTRTEAAAGYFQAVPENFSQFTQAVDQLRQTPMDSFLHRFALDQLENSTDEQTARRIRNAKKNNDFITTALLCEHLIVRRRMGKVRDHFSEQEIRELSAFSPLIHLRFALEPNRRLHARWIAQFKDNMLSHTPLPVLSSVGMPPLCAGDCAVNSPVGPEIKDLHQFHADNDNVSVFSPEKTAETALEKLTAAGVTLEEEMRHQSSLSPIALLRKWRFHTTTENGRHRFSLAGNQTSYGKGLSLEHARASLSMEIVERCASFASVSAQGVCGTQKTHSLIHAPFSSLKQAGRKAVDPGTLSMEVTYRDEPLYWIQGEHPTDEGSTPILIPAQHLFLFSNLDEIDLFSGLGSTGLASGNTLAQAKVSALLEVVERHQEGTVPFSPDTCFRLVAREEKLASLLEAYRSRGIDVLFQDITPPSGIPCCKCFVKDASGVIHKGTAAHLSARRAIISALTETTFPFPESPPSRPFSEAVIQVGYENLPDFSTGNPESDLALLEAVFMGWGKSPCYVDITRKDMGIPVVRAIVPGMEIMGDFDIFSRVHPELFQNYLSFAG